MSPADLRAQCETALLSTNLRAFLAVIRAGEGTSDADGYRRHYGGRLFDGYADHPRVAIKAGRWTSTAAGAYQFLSRTWDEAAKALALPDFSPASQDLAAVFLIRRRGALVAAMQGRLDEAIAGCAKEWASLPGSPYGQPTRTLAQAHATYAAAGGRLTSADSPTGVVQTDEASGVRTEHAHAESTSAPAAPAAPAAPDTPTPEPAAPHKEPSMPIPAIVAALLPVLTSAVPELAKLIKPDSKAAEKNATIAAKAFEVATAALGAVNAQEVAERVQSDPQAAQAVRQAVQARWYELVEVGGGIAAARESDTAAAISGLRAWHSPSFFALLLLMPLVYMLVGSIAGLWGYGQWSDDVRAAIATAVVSLIVGGASGYYWGSTTTRNKLTDRGAP